MHLVRRHQSRVARVRRLEKFKTRIEGYIRDSMRAINAWASANRKELEVGTGEELIEDLSNAVRFVVGSDAVLRNIDRRELFVVKAHC